MIELKLNKDVGAGLIFLLGGTFWLVVGWGYGLGTVSGPGPGFFPVLLSVLSMAIGAATIVRGLRQPGDPIGTVALAPLAYIAVSVVAFGLTIEPFGLLPATAATSLIASQATRAFPWRERLFLAVALSAFCAIVFVVLLQMPLRLVAI